MKLIPAPPCPSLLPAAHPHLPLPAPPSCPQLTPTCPSPPLPSARSSPPPPAVPVMLTPTSPLCSPPPLPIPVRSSPPSSSGSLTGTLTGRRGCSTPHCTSKVEGGEVRRGGRSGIPSSYANKVEGKGETFHAVQRWYNGGRLHTRREGGQGSSNVSKIHTFLYLHLDPFPHYPLPGQQNTYFNFWAITGWLATAIMQVRSLRGGAGWGSREGCGHRRKWGGKMSGQSL